MFKLLLFFLSTCSTVFATYDLAICAIFQNEAPYLKEWIEFHKIQGVQHFYLYNNNSEDNYIEVLKPYILNNDVTVVQWPYTYEFGDHAKWIYIQTKSYMDCLKNYGQGIKWLAAIDIDEFLFCTDGEKLTEFLTTYSHVGGLCVNWVKFGTSNLKEIPPERCLIEMLTHCAPYNDFEHYRVKSIVQPKYVKNCICPHYFLYKDGYYGVDVKGTKVKARHSKSILLDRIRINHYWTRTEDYFYKNKIESRQKRRPEYSTDKILQMAEKYNRIEDTAILRYLDPLRSAMEFTN